MSVDSNLPGASGQGSSPSLGNLGLVMGGRGARAAYQVGFLRCLARRHPDLRIPIITGVSAGAINAALLAGHHGTFQQAVDELVGLWSNLQIKNVFRSDMFSLVRNMSRWGTRLVSGGLRGAPERTTGRATRLPG